MLVAPDSFKGSVPAEQAAQALAAGLCAAGIDDVRRLPLADGGEGTGLVFLAMGGQRVPAKTVDIYNRPHEAYWIRYGTVAIVESALGSGFVPEAVRVADGRQTTSRGTGLLVAAALADASVTEVLVALGGTGCTDGGMGFLAALGAEFYDAQGHLLPASGEHLGRVARCRIPTVSKPVTGLYDVATPLVGPQGAVQLFGPQKGVPVDALDEMDAALAHFAAVVQAQSPADPDALGAGAAGGMGFGVLAAGGQLRNGAEAVAQWVHLDEHIAWADWIVTGEGRIDEQTRYGKVVGMVVRHGAKRQRSVIAVVGERAPSASALYRDGLTLIYPLVPGPMGRVEAMSAAVDLLRDAGEHLGHTILALERRQMGATRS